MPRKKSIKKCAKEFSDEVDRILNFFVSTQGLKENFHEWCTDYSVIRLYRQFETLMLDTISGSINNDAETISTTAGFDFPKHLNLDVCRYFIVGSGYFDFKGRDGLIRLTKKYVPETHYLLKILKDTAYKDCLEQLSAFRNFAAHDSKKAKDTARHAVGGERIGSSGSWLRKQQRFNKLCETLKSFAHDIERRAPY